MGFVSWNFTPTTVSLDLFAYEGFAIFDLTVTLTFYSIAAALSIGLCVVLLIFRHFQPDTQMLGSWIGAVLVLAAGFFISGVGPMFPPWATVVGTNLALMAAGPLLYSGFRAFCTGKPRTIDWLGWGVLLLALPAFWFWGLIEPDGHARSVVFSAGTAVINSRTAWLLWRTPSRSAKSAQWAMAFLFTVLTLWMVGRCFVLLMSDPLPPDVRGSNPTIWLTVFGYIVLLSIMTVMLMWMEISPHSQGQGKFAQRPHSMTRFVDFFRTKLLLLWIGVIILIFVMVSALGIGYVDLRKTELLSALHVIEQANDAFVNDTRHVLDQIDALLHAVRGFYLRSGSIDETRQFIQNIPFDRSAIDNLYLIAPDGSILITHLPDSIRLNVADREYYHFHRDTADDVLFIAQVEEGRVTGKLHFRCTRRIFDDHGNFAGIVLATVNPAAFNRYYQEVLRGTSYVASLVSTRDYMLRARVPDPPAGGWSQPVDTSPLWDLLTKTNSGWYENTSQVDQTRRVFVFKKVYDYPLVMVTGIANTELTAIVQERMRWAVITSVGVLSCVLVLAILLTLEAKRRDEQERFMSMLSHELKTPLSVLRLALGREAMPDAIRHHAVRSVEEMNAVVERCLEVDRLSHGHMVRRNEEINIGSMTAELCASSPDPNRFALQLHQTPPCNNDTQIIRTILSNLLDNSLKYGAQSRATDVEVFTGKHHDKPGVCVRVTNGIGPAGAPDEKCVFQKYYRAAGAHTKTGSGLGLYLAFRLAKFIEGDLRYVPSPNAVTFELWVPL